MNRLRNVLILGGILLVAAAIAGVAQPHLGRSATSASTTIVVTGNGTVNSVPDKATFDFGVQTRAANAADALDRNSGQAQAIIDALKKAGIPASDIQTEEVSLYPRTTDHGRRIASYSASNSVQVTAPLAKAGNVVDAAVAAGANNVDGPNLDVSDQSALYDQALGKAVADAKAKAEAIAAADGLTLGNSLRVREESQEVPYYGKAVFAAATAANVPIEAGTQQTQASVTVTYTAS